MITHPCSWTSSPEEYDILGQLEQVDGLIVRLGGMKFQLSTEFGYPTEFDQRKRAERIPRHMAITAAAGMLRNELYAFDDHFGIYSNMFIALRNSQASSLEQEVDERKLTINTGKQVPPMS